MKKHKMKKYKVVIYEVLTKVVGIEAEDRLDAMSKVRKKFENGEIILSADDYFDAHFACINA